MTKQLELQNPEMDFTELLANSIVWWEQFAVPILSKQKESDAEFLMARIKNMLQYVEDDQLYLAILLKLALNKIEASTTKQGSA